MVGEINLWENLISDLVNRVSMGRDIGATTGIVTVVITYHASTARNPGFLHLTFTTPCPYFPKQLEVSGERGRGVTIFRSACRPVKRSAKWGRTAVTTTS